MNLEPFVLVEKDNQRVIGTENHYSENPLKDMEPLGIHTQLTVDYLQPHDEYNNSIILVWEYKHSMEMVERYARAYLGAVAVAWFDSPNSRSRVFSYLTREVAEREQLSDPQKYLESELAEYGAWVEGDVWILDIQDKCEVVSSKKDLHIGEILESEVTRITWQTVETIGGYYGYDNAKAAAEEHLS